MVEPGVARGLKWELSRGLVGVSGDLEQGEKGSYLSFSLSEPVEFHLNLCILSSTEEEI